jgi:hypothetical protein
MKKKTNVIPFKGKRDTITLDMPFKIIDVLGEVRRDEFKYIIRDEIIENATTKQPEKITNCYSLETGHLIGNLQDAIFLCESERLTKLQKIVDGNAACQIGFNQAKGKWYGWGEAAVCDFGVDDMIFDENFGGDDDTPYRQHGTKKIKNMRDAKESATNFAKYVGIRIIK